MTTSPALIITIIIQGVLVSCQFEILFIKSLPNVKLPNINDFSSHKKLSAFIGTDPSV
ncbi:hypothetical protein PTQ35_05810 [Campylobacter sp. 46490-21]|uniref:hypothetical protein n=1 Tax=Campylobacter magnus TaxID=3026462 RepID=UPI002360B41A|nr:hypothetical protein [Campylobacter magnus]MDD0848328.1 hypothetical protein [Campylobacter magnus]